LPTLAAAAMFIAIIGLGVWTLRLHNQVQDLKKSDQAAARLRIFRACACPSGHRCTVVAVCSGDD